MSNLKEQVKIYAKNKKEEDEYKETLVNNIHKKYGNKNVKAKINKEFPTAEDVVEELKC